MSYSAGEIIDDIVHRVNDEGGKLKRSWLLHLLNVAQIDFAKQTYWFKKEYRHTIDKRFNAFVLPIDFLQLTNVKYSADGNSYTLLTPMNPEERQVFEKQISYEIQSDYQKNLEWTAISYPEQQGWTKTENRTPTHRLENGKLWITLDTGDALYWRKNTEIYLYSSLGWRLETKIILPYQTTVTTSINSYFLRTYDDSGVWFLIECITSSGDPNKIFISISSNTGIVQTITCYYRNAIIIRVTCDYPNYTFELENITTGENFAYTGVAPVFLPSSQYIIWGGFIGASGTQIDTGWEYLQVENKLDSTVIQAISGIPNLYMIKGNNFVMDAVTDGYLLLEYNNLPVKLTAETDMITVPDIGIELLTSFVLTRVYNKIGERTLSGESWDDYRNGITTISPVKTAKDDSLWQLDY